MLRTIIFILCLAITKIVIAKTATVRTAVVMETKSVCVLLLPLVAAVIASN